MDYPLRPRISATRENGSWQMIEAAIRELAEMGLPVDDEHRLGERILEDARPVGARPDHGLAEEGFLRDLARVPWSPDAPDWGDLDTNVNHAWREVILELLLARHAAAGGIEVYPPVPWENPDSGWDREVAVGPGPESIRYPLDGNREVFRRRLQAPLGTDFLPKLYSRWEHDETMRLEETLRIS